MLSYNQGFMAIAAIILFIAFADYGYNQKYPSQERLEYSDTVQYEQADPESKDMHKKIVNTIVTTGFLAIAAIVCFISSADYGHKQKFPSQIIVTAAPMKVARANWQFTAISTDGTRISKESWIRALNNDEDWGAVAAEAVSIGLDWTAKGNKLIIIGPKKMMDMIPSEFHTITINRHT